MIIKKEVEAVPLFPAYNGERNNWVRCTTGGDVVTLPRSGKVLIIDIYATDGEFKSRFASDGNAFISAYEWPVEKWTQRNPSCALHEYTAISSEAFDETVRHFFKSKSSTRNAYEEMDRFVSKKSEERREKAWQAQNALRQKHFAMYPAYPSDINEYCGKRVFEHTYIFISKIQKDRKRTAKCAHCGKSFKVDASVKQGSDGVCPNCGAKAVYKADWQKMPYDESKICICSRVDNQLLIRWTEVHRMYKGFVEQYGYFDYAYNLFLNDGVYFYKFFKSPYAYDYDWHRGQKGDICYDSTKVYSSNLREVFGADYYGVDLQKEFEARNPTVKVAKLIFNLKTEPVSKHLLKLGMIPLAADADLVGYNRHAEKPSFTSVMGVSRQLIPLYRDFNISALEHRVIKAYGGWVSGEDIQKYRKFGISYSTDTVIALLSQMTFSRFVNYIEKQKCANKKRSYSLLITEFRDYLDMSKALGVDLSHKSVRFPSDIVTAHAQITARYNAAKSAIEDKYFAEKVKPLYENLPENYREKDFCIVLPQLRSDLITEGQSLNHCVGGDRYYRNHISGKKMIFFVRKLSAPTKPFFTMEIDMESCKVLQLYGFGDCSAPKEVREFAEKYARKLNKHNSNSKTA